MVTQTPDGKILFQFYRPGARQVSIAGDFNGWAPSFQMTRNRDGWWRSRIELAPGTYRFRYVADREWFTDYAAFGVEPCPGGWNSVVKVDAPVTPNAKPAPAAAKPAVPAHTVVTRPAPIEPPVRFIVAGLTSAEPERRVRRPPAMVN